MWFLSSWCRLADSILRYKYHLGMLFFGIVMRFLSFGILHDFKKCKLFTNPY